MQYFQFIRLNQETFIVCCFSTHTLIVPKPGNKPYCEMRKGKRSPLKINDNTEDINVGMIQAFWSSYSTGLVTCEG